jgi:hypothetical protein
MSEADTIANELRDDIRRVRAGRETMIFKGRSVGLSRRVPYSVWHRELHAREADLGPTWAERKRDEGTQP